MDKRNLKIIGKEENVIVHKVVCEQTASRIEFIHVDGDVEDSEFHFHAGQKEVVIGKKDLFKFIQMLELPFPKGE